MILPQTCGKTEANLAICGALGGASANSGTAKPGASIMSSLTVETVSKSQRAVQKSAQDAKVASRTSINASKKDRSNSKNPNSSRDEQRETKQERVLTLLRRPGGASIEEIMRATNWQQHSVRGFFAGTIKKKLGLTLASSKADGQLRRYRIETRRVR